MERDLIPLYALQQNGLTERVTRTFVESARSMLVHAKFPLQFWAEAAANAADIRYRFLPCDGNIAAYEIVTGKVPRVDHLRIFGSTAWADIPNEKRKKLEPKSEEVVPITCFETGLYKVWVKNRNKAIITKHGNILE